MRIQRIQSLQFMALRYDSHAEKKLDKAKLRALEDNLKDTKYTDMEIIGKEANPSIVTPYGKYSYYFTPISQDFDFASYLRVRTVWEGENIHNLVIPGRSYVISIPMGSYDIRMNYHKMKNAQDEYDRCAILTKILDEHFTRQKEINEMKEQE